jgi:hypothetical protein
MSRPLLLESALCCALHAAQKGDVQRKQKINAMGGSGMDCLRAVLVVTGWHQLQFAAVSFLQLHQICCIVSQNLMDVPLV